MNLGKVKLNKGYPANCSVHKFLFGFRIVEKLVSVFEGPCFLIYSGAVVQLVVSAEIVLGKQFV